jgi:pimeloyl-ACP methyl ester carboxylesterase
MHFEKKGSGPAVVLVHGLGASSFSWRDTVAALSKHHTTYAVDLLGFGQSAAPSSFAYTAQAQADAVAAFITAQGLSKPAIIGHSMGGGVCLYLADKAAQGSMPSLGKMVLVAAVASKVPPSMGGAIKTLSGLVEGPEAAASAPVLGRILAEKILQAAYASPSAVTKAQIDGYAKGLSSPGQLRAFTGHAKTLSQVSFPQATLAGIKTETLVIWGKQDRFLPFDLGEKLAKSLGKASLAPIDNCGHIPQEERAKDTNKLIENFLK